MIWDAAVFTGVGAFDDERFVAVKGKWKGIKGEVGLANVYGAHAIDQKVGLRRRISSLMDRVGGAWWLFGDFNDVRDLVEWINSEVNIRDS